MIQKPEIQYVGQFYIYGSEAQKLEVKKERKKAKTRLPLARLEKIEKIYVDPVALVSIAVAVVMLVVMAVGMLQLREDWTEYEAMSGYVSRLRQENAQLSRDYRESFDLEEIRAQALGLGLVPESEVTSFSVTVTVPEPEPERTWIDDLIWFWEGLFA